MGHTDAATTAPQPAITAEDLPNDLGILKQMIVELLASMQERDRDLQATRHRLELLLQRLYGKKSERLDPSQVLLFPDALTAQDNSPPPPAEARPKRKCRPHGRRRLPENLPRVPKHHVLTEAQLTCATCGQQREEIGVDRSEQLDYKPASLFIIEHFVHKYACPCCAKASLQGTPPVKQATPEPIPEPTPQPVVPPSMPGPSEPANVTEPTTMPTEPAADSGVPTGQGPQTPLACLPSGPPAPVVIAASKPAMPIAKGMPAAGLLAHLIVSKYVDHLPLHRLENIYEREGAFLPRSTLSGWLMSCGRLLRPLYDRLVYWALQSKALHTDDTPVKMQELKTHLLSTARMWAYLGDASHPCNVFDFTLTRKRDGPRQFLANYQGYLHADAFSGYDCLYLPDPQTTRARISEVACNAHARRKFYEARTSDGLRSHLALGYYRQLYELERQAKDFNETQRLQMRQDLSLPILEKFHDWIEKEHKEVLPKSPMADAFGYVRNNWAALIRYTEAGYLAIDNNAAEREMKRIAIGRKNWLFVGSPSGGQTAAVLMSFTSTCHRLEIEPWSYLHDVLSRVPTTPAGQLDELIPDRWLVARRASQTAAASTTSTAPTVPSSVSGS